MIRHMLHMLLDIKGWEFISVKAIYLYKQLCVVEFRMETSKKTSPQNPKESREGCACTLVGVFFFFCFWHTLPWMPIKLTVKWVCRSLNRGVSFLENNACGFCDLAAINISLVQPHSAVSRHHSWLMKHRKNRRPSIDMLGRWQFPSVMAWAKYTLGTS